METLTLSGIDEFKEIIRNLGTGDIVVFRTDKYSLVFRTDKYSLVENGNIL